MLIASVVAFPIGHPLIGLSFRNEKTNAAFRYALVRLRDAAEAVGFYRGEHAEAPNSTPGFPPSSPTTGITFDGRSAFLAGTASVTASRFFRYPYVCQAPRLFAGAIKFGDVAQSSTAFSKIQIGVVVLPQRL